MSDYQGEIHVSLLNATYIQIGAETSILKEIGEFFVFDVPNARFNPKFKHGVWDGKIRLFNYKTQTLYTGLHGHLKKFAAERHYKVIEYDNILSLECLKFDDYDRFMKDLNIHSDGIKLTARHYQDSAILHGINAGRCTIVSPTSSGKSYIIYALLRWHQQFDRKILIVVPTVSLVNQMYSDFKDYSSEVEWNHRDNCHKIFSGQDKTSNKPVIISTWQSMQKQNMEFFKPFDVIFTDEVHTAKATQLKQILEKSINAYHRYGLTGTLQDTECNRLVIVGLHGPAKKIIKTKQLMDEGYIAELAIKCVILKYPTRDRDFVRKMHIRAKKEKKNAYKQEVDFIVAHKKRMEQLVSLSLAVKGNTLILFQYVESHGKIIYEKLLQKSQKEVYYISGETKPEEREKIRKAMEKKKNVILVASYGTFSTGVNVKQIHNVIFASPSKSKIKVLQSIGRGLRIGKGKTSVTLWDIVDDISKQNRKTKSHNYVFKHFLERWKIYKQEQFKLKIYERQL